ncbi:hypothetical protein [Terrabacter sp. RAF57]|uniref:hypothetical protein n=1 Tax=Terrabacter sp. RAF57 TaxID=3233063 RepID=UPI003F946941
MTMAPGESEFETAPTQSGLATRDAGKVRRELAMAIAITLGEFSSQSREIVLPEGPKEHVLAAGLVGAIGFELVHGIVHLADVRNAYAASALVRQLVEAEYLAWAFSEDADEAVEWMTSDARARRARWQPRHLRSRAGKLFPASDYSDHCEHGGHPTPSGSIKILDNRQYVVETALADAGVHGIAACHYLLDVFEKHDLGHLFAEAHHAMDAVHEQWKVVDPLARLSRERWPV